MKIFYDHQIFSYQTYGGASRYYCEIMNEFTSSGSVLFDLGVKTSPNEYLKNAPFYKGAYKRKRSTADFFTAYIRNSMETKRLLRKNSYDIVHATFYDPSSCRVPRGSMLATTVLDMIPEHFPEMFDTKSVYGSLITKRWIDGKRISCNAADIIFAISEKTKQDVVKFYGIAPEKIHVTHLANRLKRSDDAVKNSALPKDYILFVGTRNTYKNFSLFLEAAAPHIVSSSLSIVCVGGGAFSKGELDGIDRLGLNGRIMQMNVRDDEVAACYMHARAFVFPSLYEGFGIPILEAFSCGCPAIIANASCFPEIGGDAALYFDPKDRNDLHTVIGRVLEDAGLRTQLIEKGYSRAKEFTWERTAAETAAVYAQACAKKHGA